MPEMFAYLKRVKLKSRKILILIFFILTLIIVLKIFLQPCIHKPTTVTRTTATSKDKTFAFYK